VCGQIWAGSTWLRGQGAGRDAVLQPGEPMRGRTDDAWTERGKQHTGRRSAKGRKKEKERELTLLLHVVLCKHLKELWTFDFRSHFCQRGGGRTRGRGGERGGAQPPVHQQISVPCLRSLYTFLLMLKKKKRLSWKLRQKGRKERILSSALFFKMERKEGSRSGSYTWVTAGRDSQLLQSATISHSAVTNKTRWGRDVSPTSQNEMPLFVSSHRAGLSENSSLLHLLNPTRRQMRRLMHTDFYFVFCFC